MFKVPFEMIICEPTKNCRIDYGDIEELALSILENGQRNPIRATRVGGNSEETLRYILRDGFRRYCAVQYIRDVLKKDFPEMLVLGTGVKYSESDALYEQIISNQGKPLNMLEEGNAYVALKTNGNKEAAIAKKVGKSVQHIYNCLTLADLSFELKQFIIRGQVKPTLMLELCKQYPDSAELAQIITTRLEDKVERTDTKQSVLPFEVTDGKIDVESQYDIPAKNCKLTAKDFQSTEEDVDKDAKEKKEKDYSFLDTDPIPPVPTKNEVEPHDRPMVILETLRNVLINDEVTTPSALIFIKIVEMAKEGATTDAMLELFI
jgi:ParB/RepB/Spo0J family partition protein